MSKNKILSGNPKVILVLLAFAVLICSLFSFSGVVNASDKIYVNKENFIADSNPLIIHSNQTCLGKALILHNGAFIKDNKCYELTIEKGLYKVHSFDLKK